MVDSEIGFIPEIGGPKYNDYATLRNSYDPVKRPGVCRILFAGDSVTARSKITAPLEKLYGAGNPEFWNAGVDAYNTVQELQLYKRYNSKLSPDQVILFFHLNDYEASYVVYRDSGGKLRAIAPDRPLVQINRWLFLNSMIYRLYLGVTLSRDEGWEKVKEDVEASLLEFKRTLEKDNISFTVVVLPSMWPYEKWSDSDKIARQNILSLLDTAGIRHFDLIQPLKTAVEAGKMLQEAPGDFWHPHAEAGEVFAEYLFGHELIDRSRCPGSLGR